MWEGRAERSFAFWCNGGVLRRQSVRLLQTKEKSHSHQRCFSRISEQEEKSFRGREIPLNLPLSCCWLRVVTSVLFSRERNRNSHCECCAKFSGEGREGRVKTGQLEILSYLWLWKGGGQAVSAYPDSSFSPSHSLNKKGKGSAGLHHSCVYVFVLPSSVLSWTVSDLGLAVSSTGPAWLVDVRIHILKIHPEVLLIPNFRRTHCVIFCKRLRP